MNHSLRHYIKITTVAHIVVLVVLTLVSSISFIFRKKLAPVIPVGFIMDAGGGAAAAVEKPRAAEKPVVTKPPKPEVVKAKKEVVVNRDRIVRPVKRSKPKPLVSARDVARLKRLLEKNAPAGGPVAGGLGGPVADDEVRCLSLIQGALYEAWVDRPSVEEAGEATVEIALTMAADGRILKREIAKASGNRKMDESAMLAVQSVEEVAGLTDSFLKRHEYRITVAFQLEPEEP